MRFIVHGSSMEPTFNEGDRLFVSSLPYWFKRPKKNDLVVFSHSFRNKLILKRIALVLPHDEYQVVGDNSLESEDSRSFGSIAKEQILGKVIFRY